jgi:hypothetical protein
MSRRAVSAQTYAAIFEDDPRGAAILDDLANRFARQPVVDKGGIDAVLQTYRRSGNREVVNFILLRIGQARSGDSNSSNEE